MSIPAHPSLTPPKTIKVNRYEAAEAAGLLWVAAAGSNDPLQDPGGKWLPIQSIDLSRPLVEVRSAIANAGSANENDFDGASAADAAGSSGSSAQATGSEGPIIEFQDERLDRKVLCALQAVGETSTAVHILVSAEGAGEDDAVRRTYAKWGRRLRRGQSTTARAPLALVAASAAERHTRPLA